MMVEQLINYPEISTNNSHYRLGLNIPSEFGIKITDTWQKPNGLVNYNPFGTSPLFLPSIMSRQELSPAFKLLKVLQDLFSQPEGSRWPEAKWPTEDALEDAREFIQNLPFNEISPPEIGFYDDGEINFLWSTEVLHVDLGFYGTGNYSYFGKNDKGDEILGDDILASNGLDKKLYKFMVN